MNWFIDPIVKQYADFNGRTGQEAFWMYVLIYWIVILVAGTISDIIGGILALALLLPNLAITARRLHDVGKSGWWMLVSLIPIIGAVILIVFCATKSDEGPNQYGSPSSTNSKLADLSPIPPPNQSVQETNQSEDRA